MMLNTRDEQMALDYTIYMMVGSFFKKARPDSKARERILRMRYQLLSENKQYYLEEESERYFENKILPGLPADFLAGTATVRHVRSDDGKYTAVVFARGGRQLWITSLYGGKYRRPRFRHWVR